MHPFSCTRAANTEKPQIQALERTALVLPMVPGKPSTRAATAAVTSPAAPHWST